MPALMSAAIQALSRVPIVYRLQQYIAQPTTSRFRHMIVRHVAIGAEQRVLDVACGIGTYREILGGQYYGCDINAAYIESARSRHVGQFDVMDCCRLAYQDGFFDHVITVAATHHLDDVQLDQMICGALRVSRTDGAVHVLDAVLPFAGNRLFKRAWFGIDMGRFPRRPEHLRALLEKCGSVEREELVPGPLHDCAYFQLKKSAVLGDLNRADRRSAGATTTR